MSRKNPPTGGFLRGPTSLTFGSFLSRINKKPCSMKKIIYFLLSVLCIGCATTFDIPFPKNETCEFSFVSGSHYQTIFLDTCDSVISVTIGAYDVIDVIWDETPFLVLLFPSYRSKAVFVKRGEDTVRIHAADLTRGVYRMVIRQQEAPYEYKSFFVHKEMY
jgi:hypothetical protein